MDSHQAIYDAVRSRISNGDIGAAVATAMAAANLSFYADQAAQHVYWAASQHATPSAVFRPRLFLDGDQYCALYGENLQDGVAGFGDTAAAAMADFDVNWTNAVAPKSALGGRYEPTHWMPLPPAPTDSPAHPEDEE